jgi:hypothetical protein
LVNPTFPINIAYVVQLSSSPLFPGNATVTSGQRISGDTTDQSISFPARFTGDTFLQFLRDHFGSATTIWWRVGARNIEDNPGPLPDPTTGLRYIFSNTQPFTIPSGAPPKSKAVQSKKTVLPANTGKTKKGPWWGKH